jgi:catechol 2,3-dioxygenase-like lactoylglutathione lyase family enzyme
MTDDQSPLGRIGLAATTFYVSDLDAAVAWYRDCLALEPQVIGAVGEEYASYLIGGSILVLEPRTAALDAAVPGSESTTVNLVVDRDPANVRSDLVRSGVECGEIVDSLHYRSFLVRDLDGNRFYVTRPASDAANADVEQWAATMT